MSTAQIFQFVVLIFSVVIHEVSHGYAALRLGDTTAKDAGRLTLNPLKHLDPVGSVFLPLTLMLINSPVLFGWARPVPYNPLNLKNPKKGAALIGAAGPLSNITIAVVFGLLLRIFGGGAPEGLTILMNVVILINLILAIFNLIPIPPLDGSSILFSVLPPKAYKIQAFLMRYGFLILIVFLFSPLFDMVVQPIVFGLYRLITGPAGLL